jgi:phytoene synthase
MKAGRAPRGRAPVSWRGYAPWADTVAACRREFVQVARAFWLIPELIPQPARDDIALLYCVCRRLDDDVDEAPERLAAVAALARWRAELAGASPPRPLVAAFLAGVPRSGLPLACLAHLLDGMERDLADVRIPDDDDLLRYADRVSAAVGLMLAPLLGVRGDAAEHRVVDLGLALQISNVLLGVAGDARRGRVYLPATRLAAAGLTAAEVVARPGDPRVGAVLRGLAALADRYHASAERGVAVVPLRYRHGVVLLGRAYRDLGWRAARGARAPDAPLALPARAKAFHLLALAATAWSPRKLGLRDAPPHLQELHRSLVGWRGARALTSPAMAQPTPVRSPGTGGDAAIEPPANATEGPPPITVTTAMAIAAAPTTIWDRLVFYEQLDERPPLHLRLLLPVPIRTEGAKEAVGDEVRCLYEGGHVIKRVTAIEPARRYAFEIAEQALDVGGGMRLSGGQYEIRELAPGRCELTITTRYTSARWPRWMWRPLEAAVCHSFHRHLLRAMRRAMEAR